MAAAGVAAVVKERAKTGPAAPWLKGAPLELARRPDRFVFNNGAVGVEIQRDGRGAAFVMGAERGGGSIDLFRRPLDPLQARGHFFYLSEDGEPPWSIGFEPARRAGDYRIEEPGFNRLAIVHALNGVEARMEVAPDSEGAVIGWRVRLVNRSDRTRQLRLTSFCEIAGAEPGAYAKDLDFAGMHVETMFVRPLNAILARNRLLRSARADRGETSFFAVKPGSGTALLGYEDLRIRFIGEGSLLKPTGCEPWRWRKLDDEGKVWTFDPAASFTLGATLAAGAVAEAEFIVGRSDNAVWASELIARRLGLAPLPEPELRTRLYETRAVEPSPALHSRWPFAFSADGKRLSLTHRTPRPWAHVMANELGMATMVSNDGEIFSAFGNARQNGLSAFRFDSVTVVQPGQIVYLHDLDTGETGAVGFAPFQREDGIHEATYEPGVATFAAARGDLTMDYAVFVPPDYPGDMRLLTLRNRGATPKRLRVAPFFDLALEDSPNASVDRIRDETVGSTLLFQNPQQRFRARLRLRRDDLARAGDRDHPGPVLRRPGAQHPVAGDGRDRRQRRFRPRRRTAGRRLLRRAHAAAWRRSQDRHRLRPGAEPGGRARRRRARRRRRGRKRACGDPRLVGRAPRPGRGANQPAGLRPAGQHLAALPALRVAALRPPGPEPARRRDRLSRPAAGRAAACPHRAQIDPGADRAARKPAVSRGRRSQVVASRARRRDGSRPADQSQRPAPLAALRSRPLRASNRRSDRARRDDAVP